VAFRKLIAIFVSTPLDMTNSVPYSGYTFKTEAEMNLRRRD
jgi:hypothetical protein